MNARAKFVGKDSPFPSGMDRWNGWHARMCKPSVMALLGAVAATLLIFWCDGVAGIVGRPDAGWQERANLPAWHFLTAQDWLQRARQRAASGEFRRALGTINRALALAPRDAGLLDFKGDMFESSLRFHDAQMAYENALQSDAGNRHARENLMLCQRLNRVHGDPASRRSTLYALHRAMLDQGRVDEAIAIGESMRSDHLLWQASWQAALDQTGLPGKITVTEDGMMNLDLSGVVQPDLNLITDFPLASLDLSDTRLADIRALRGMTLEKLDLSRTMVAELSALRGMPLRTLRIPGTGVTDLSPLAGCPLQEMDISGTRVADLSALVHSQLTVLRAADTRVADLHPLSSLPLSRLYLSRSRVMDLQPLCCLGLRELALDGTMVSDLSPLQGGPLDELHLASTNVRDLRPLAGMPLRILDLSDCEHVMDLRPLATCHELEHLMIPPQAGGVETLGKLPRLRFIQRKEINHAERLLSILEPIRHQRRTGLF